MLRRTASVPASGSMSFHCSASASDWRRPRASATVQRAELRTRAAASRTARASSRAAPGGRAAGLLEVERGGDVAGPLRGWVDQAGDIARNVTALDGDGEGAGQDPVVAQ